MKCLTFSVCQPIFPVLMLLFFPTPIYAADTALRKDTYIVGGELDYPPYVLVTDAYSKERDKVFDFTSPHTIIYNTYFMRKGEISLESEQDLRDKTVIVMRADSTHEHLKTNTLAIYRYALVSGIFLLFISIIVLLWLRLLKKQVTSRTANLVAEIRERQRIEKALKDSEHRYRRLVEGMQRSIIYSHDTKGVFTYISPTVKNLLGFSQEEFRTHYATFLTDHPNNAKAVAYTEAAIRGEQQPPYELEIWRKDSGKMCLEITEHPVFDEQDHVIAVEGIANDITERKQAELALQMSEARFRALVDAVPYGVEEINIEGRVIFTNIARNRMLGYAETEIVGKTIWDFMDDATKQEIQAHFVRLLKDQPLPTPAFSTNRTKSGQMIEVQIDWNYKRDSEGHIIGFVVVLTNVTEHKRAERALRESEEKYRVLFQLFPVGISITDPTGQLIEVNQLSEKLLDISIPAHLKRHYNDDSWHIIRSDGSILPSEEYASVRALKEQTTVIGVEMGIVKYDGQVTWLSVSAAPIPLEQYGVAIAYIDITERKIIEEALQRSEARLAEAQQLARLGFWEWNLISGEEHCSKEIWQILGLSEEKTVFTHELFERAIYFADSSTVLDAFEQAITENKCYDLVFRIVRPDNTIHYIHALGRLIRDVKGKIQRFIGTAQDITDRKLAEEKVRKSEEKLSAITTNAPAYIYEIDREGKILFVNRVYEGLTCQDVVGTSLIDWFPPEHRTSIQATIAKVFASGQLQSIEYTISNSQGTIRSYTTQIAPIKIGDEFNSIVLIANDFTERKQMEEALRESQTRLAEAQRIAHVGNWIWYIKTNDVVWSDEVYRIFGTEPQKFSATYQNFLDYAHPSDRHLVQGAINEALYEKKPYSIDHRIVLSDGSIHFVHEQAEIAFDDRNESVQLIGIIQDITERKLAEEALRASEQYRRTLIEEALIGLVLIDKMGGFIEVNSAFAKMIGYTPEEVIDHLSCLEITPTEYFEEDKRQIQQLRESKRFGPYEKEYIHKNGQRIPVRVSGLLIEYKGQKFAWTNVENITIQKHTEDVLRNAKNAAEAANHAKSTFLANMSHELRTPLNGILGYTQLFKLDRTLTPEQQEGIDIIHRSGEHLLNLINDILDLSKVEAGRIELQEADFNFKSFIDGIIYLFKMRAQQRDVVFDYEQLSHLPYTVHADETRLRQILVNLLSNAIKFAHRKVSLKIGYHLEKIRFQIEDDGIGIAENDIERIFLPFQQVGDKTYKMQGTGLGLSITKKLVTMMSGTIQVTSALGKGSVFWVEFKLSEVTGLLEEEDDPVQKPRIVGFEEPTYKILVVDDIEENRLIIVNYLTSLGFEMLEAENGLEGINVALTYQPELILMDLIMPKMDGFEAVHQIRALPTLKNVIIIAVSASAFDFHQQKSIQAGCNDFIAKPLRYEELLEKLQQYLHLTWIYEVNTEEGSNDLPLKFAGPAPEQASILLDLAMQGDILGITSYMTALTKHDETLVLFASEVCHLARNFKTAKICELARCYIGSSKNKG